MIIFKQNTNMTSVILSSDCAALQFRIKKSAGATSIGEFLGSDTLQMILNNQGSQQSEPCPTLPLIMLAYAATMRQGYMKAVYDEKNPGKIIELQLRVDVGYQGSVPLTDSRQLLITTNISGLDSSGDSLECAVIADGRWRDASGNAVNPAIVTYSYVHIEAGNKKNIDVSTASAAILTKGEKSVTMIDRFGSSYVQSIESLASMSRALNEVAAMYGFDVADKAAISGKLIDTQVFKATATEGGGERYICLWVDLYTQLQVRSTDVDGVLLVTPKYLQ